MKIVYSDLHHMQHAEAEYIRGKRVASFEMPRRAELVLERVRAVGLGPVVGIGDYGLETIGKVHEGNSGRFLWPPGRPGGAGGGVLDSWSDMKPETPFGSISLASLAKNI